MRICDALLSEVTEPGDPGPRSIRPGWLGVAVYLRVQAGEQQQAAGTAASFPRGTQSPWNTASMAHALDEAVNVLAGTGLDADNPLDCAAEVARRFRDAVAPAALTRRQRGALDTVVGAVETGLLDAIARAAGVSLPTMLGARRAVPSRSARTVPAGSSVSVVEEKVGAQRGRYPAVRLAARGEPARDLDALLAAERAGAAAGGAHPLWLECAGRYSVEQAEGLVDEIASMLADGRLTRPILLEQPVRRLHRDALAALIRRAHTLTGPDAAGGKPELRIVLDESVESLDDLSGFLQDGPVRAVSVDLRRGLGTAIRVVERALAADPAVTVILSSPGRVTDLEAAAIEAAAQVLPKLDFYLPGRINVELGGMPGAEEGAAPAGLGVQPSLARVVTWMGRAALGRLSPEPVDTGTEQNTFDATGLETLGKNSLDSYLLEKEARRLGLATVRFRGVDFHAEDTEGRSIGFHCTTGPSTSRLVAKICGQKQVTRAYLARAGVSVPRGQLFAAPDRRSALEFAETLGWPVVVKPPEGKGGTGVVSNITGADRFLRAFSRLRDDGYEQVIVEKHIPGTDYRFLVVGGGVVSVLSRRPGGVTGDGRSTIAELVLAKNLVRLRNPHLRSRLLTLGSEAVNLLTAGGMTPDSVPQKGEQVTLTTAGNISRGGESIEVLDEAHPSLLDLAVRAVRAVPGLDHAGVDLLAEDHRRPLDSQAAAVCELNSLPATSSHHFPALGPPRNVSKALVGFYAGQYALATAPQPDVLAVRIRITGQVQAVGYRQWFANLAGPLGLNGWIRNSTEPDVVEAAVSGPLDLVSAVSLQAIFGPPKSRPELVETRVVSEAHQGGFAVHR
ncbi:acylphosphatase [Phytoactinopolyspora mesophila]|nr:acylphosphatase [Phytoactinopolyspora mesophila]